MMEDGFMSFTPVQVPIDLQPRYAELRRIMEQNQRVFDAVEEALGRVVMQFYPSMKEWSPEQLHGLACLIAQQAARFSCGVSELNEGSRQTPTSEDGTPTIASPRFSNLPLGSQPIVPPTLPR